MFETADYDSYTTVGRMDRHDVATLSSDVFTGSRAKYKQTLLAAVGSPVQYCDSEQSLRAIYVIEWCFVSILFIDLFDTNTASQSAINCTVPLFFI